MSVPSIDGTLAAATKDQQTVSSSGRPVGLNIDGIAVSSPPVHPDHRGRVFEVFTGPNDFWEQPVVYCYCFTVRALQIKGWGLHLHKDDRYTIIHGEMVVVLYDARTDSDTYGMTQQVTMSAEGVRQLLIPAGVWHADVNVSGEEVKLINLPTAPYSYEDPDRYLLPWDTAEIPFDLASVFPVQVRPRT
jgi:dTDP-4-dehydrorhamnose 3,5-epimerase